MSGIAGMLDMDAVRKLSVTDRIDLIGMIWDTLAEENADIPLTEVQEAELERRLADYKANPESVVPWETVKADLRRIIDSGTE